MLAAMSSYDRVHYPAKPYHVTRPDHLEVLGRLFGVPTRSAEEARLLEIGCGVGDNLLLAAECFPRARVLGIDLAASQIEAGQRLLRQVGLTNVDLQALDLNQLDGTFGQFDYIIAHGVYSWVPEAVRRALLDVIRARLAPTGIAFVSHNVKPGWYAKSLARDMMRYRTRGLAEPGARVGTARTFLERIVAGTNPSERLYRAVLAERVQANANQDSDVLFHDDLSDFCEGEWFWEVAARLGAQGLQFLCDANTETLGSTGLAAETVRELEELAANVVEREQYLDFVRNRAFRMTLICHAGLPLNRELRPEQLFPLQVGLDPGVTEIGIGSGGTVAVSTKSTRMQVADPLTKAALIALGQIWPGTVAFAELFERILDNSEREGRTALAARLLELLRTGIVAVAMRPPTFAQTVPTRPRASGLARLAAEVSPKVVNLRHTYSIVSDEDLAVLRLCDGRCSAEELAIPLERSPDAIAAALERLNRLALFVNDTDDTEKR